MKKLADTRFSEYLDASNKALRGALKQLYPRLPSWIPEPNIARINRIILKLLNQGLSAETIKDKVAEALKDDLTFPGTVTDPAAFAQEIYELAGLKWAIKQGPERGLKALAGSAASLGQKFKSGRKKGAYGPVKKLVLDALKKNPNLTNDQLWRKLENLPEEFVTRDTTHSGRYIDGRHGLVMQYPRFRSVCAEVRKELGISRFSEK
jgi:hypothetical protein